jgi:hypothetical protein
VEPPIDRRQVAASDGSSWLQLITLAIDASKRPYAVAVCAAVGSVAGVDAVELDPLSGRVWVFADGIVDPQRLCDALAAWGFEAYVIERRFAATA